MTFFAPTSPWNLKLNSTTKFLPLSDPATKALRQYAPYTALNSKQWSIPVVRASSTDPWVRIDYDRWDGKQYVLTGESETIQLPATAEASPDDDKELVVISPDGRIIHEYWNARKQSPASWRVQAGMVGEISGQGFHGIAATGASVLGGLITLAEFRAGVIQHRIATTLMQAQLSKLGPVPPAWNDDWDRDTTHTGPIRPGSILGIPRSEDLSTRGLSPAGLMTATAYQTHGGIVRDSSRSNMAIYAEQAASADPVAARQIEDIKRDLPKFMPLLRIVA